MKTILSVAITAALFLAQSWAEQSDDERVLLTEDFDRSADEGLAGALLAHRHIRLASSAGTDGSDAIRVAYVGYERGSERVTARYPLGVNVAQATLAFDVRFDVDFQWVKGGKLHGLGPKRPITGGRERIPEGWSARVTFKPDGHCASYLYDQDKDRTYGVGQTSNGPVFEAGKWHRVSLQVSLNDPGESNGHARISVDGKPVVETRNVVFREAGGEDTLIQQFLFSTFHGGHEPHWAPVDADGNFKTVYAYFDNFVVTGSDR